MQIWLLKTIYFSHVNGVNIRMRCEELDSFLDISTGGFELLHESLLTYEGYPEGYSRESASHMIHNDSNTAFLTNHSLSFHSSVSSYFQDHHAQYYLQIRRIFDHAEAVFHFSYYVSFSLYQWTFLWWSLIRWLLLLLQRRVFPLECYWLNLLSIGMSIYLRRIPFHLLLH